MKLNNLRILPILYFLCVLLSSCNHTEKMDLLLGSWTFDKFEYVGELSNIPDSLAKKENEMNKGMSIIFSSNNKFSSMQKGGIDNNNENGTYNLLPDDRLVIMGDTSKIIQLEKNHLKLYKNKFSPVISFIKQ